MSDPEPGSGPAPMTSPLRQWWRSAPAEAGADLALAAVLVILFSALLGALGFVVHLALQGSLDGPIRDSGGDIPVEALVGAMLGMHAGILATWLLRRRGLRRLAPRGGRTRSLALAVAGALAAVAISVLLSLLGSAGGEQVVPSNAAPLAELSRRPWLGVALIVILAPLAEELLMRHMLLRRFVVAGRPLLGLLLTSLLFALLHEPGAEDRGTLAYVSALTIYAAMSVCYGAVYLATGRYWAAALAHALNNTVGLIALYAAPV